MVPALVGIISVELSLVADVAVVCMCRLTTAVVALLVGLIVFDLQHDFVSHCGHEHEGLFRRNILPLADLIRIDRSCAFSDSKHNHRCRVLCVDLRFVYWCHTSSPDAVTMFGNASDLPCNLMIAPSDFFQNVISRVEGADENAGCEKTNVAIINQIRSNVEESKEAGGIGLIDHVAKVAEMFIDPQVLAYGLGHGWSSR